jgi:hypothetical protein
VVNIKIILIFRILYMIFKLIKLTVSSFITLAKGNKDLHKRECFSILSLQMIRVKDLERGLVESVLNITFINV